MAKKTSLSRGSGKAGKASAPRIMQDPWGELPAVKAIDKKVWLLLAVMVAGIVLIYARALGYGFTAWDDPGYVTENAALGPLNAHQVQVEFERNVMGNFHPITMLSYALDISVAGEKSARMMHLTAVLLHVLNALLVFLLIRALLGDPLIAVFVALLFAWHPMRVESVAWISDRKDLLMLFFGVLTLLCYVKALRSRSFIWLLAALPLFVLACLSKATAVALVPSLFLIDLLAGRSLWAWRPWLEKAAFGAIALAIGLLTVPAQKEGITFGAQLDIPLGQRIILAAANIPIYLGQLTVPLGVGPFHGYANLPAGQAGAGHGVPEGYLVIALLLLPLGWLLYRLRSSRQVLFAALFFLVNIALLLQLTSVGQAMRADRYTYLPSLGWGLLAVFFVQWLLKRVNRPGLLLPGIVGYACVLGAMAFLHVPTWKDPMSVWDRMIADDPDAHVAYACRSGTHYRNGDYAKALTDAETALRIDPQESLARYNRGLSLMKFDRYNEAVQDLMPFAGLPGADDKLYESLVFGLMRTGRCDAALVFCDTLLRRVPDHWDILNKQAYCLAKQGKVEAARKAIDRSLAIKSENAEGWFTLAYMHMNAGDTAAACEAWQRSAQWPLKDSTSTKARRQLIERFCGKRSQ